MSEVMQEVLDSLAKIGKQWGLGAPVGRVWGFLLFKSCPVTQREIEEGTGYSRGLVSRSLKKLKMGPMIEISREGREILYLANTSLTEEFKKNQRCKSKGDFSCTHKRIQKIGPRCSPVLEDNRRYKYDARGCRERRGSGREDFNKYNDLKEAIRNE